MRGSIINGKFVVYEDTECEIFAQWLNTTGLLYSKVAQETWTDSGGQKARNKAQGLQKGVPDYIIITPLGLVFVEMKRRANSTVSKEQKQWIAALDKCEGVDVRVCYGADEAKAYIKEFLTMKKCSPTNAPSVTNPQTQPPTTL